MTDNTVLTLTNAANILCGKPDWAVQISSAVNAWTEFDGTNARRQSTRLVVAVNGENGLLELAINTSGSAPSERDLIVPRNGRLDIILHPGERLWYKASNNDHTIAAWRM